MSPGATNVVTRQMVPLLGMMWRGMWGAAAATAAAQAIAAEDSSDDLEEEPV